MSIGNFFQKGFLCVNYYNFLQKIEENFMQTTNKSEHDVFAFTIKFLYFISLFHFLNNFFRNMKNAIPPIIANAPAAAATIHPIGFELASEISERSV